MIPPDAAPAAAEAAPEAPIPPTPEPPPAEPGPRLLQFSFTGDEREYFRIWVVNLFLSIVTLGIYSAWAKVRKKRYFYGNTWVDGSNFDYHGDPKAILKGRIVAVGAFVSYTLLAEFSPRAGAILALAVLPLVPWLLLRSFRFNAVNSSWRNLRFGFRGRYRDVLFPLLPLFAFPIATVIFPNLAPDQGNFGWGEIAAMMMPALLFGLFYPWMVGRLRLVRINGSSFGDAPFSCAARIRSFYRIYFVAGFLLGFAITVFSMIAGAVAFGMLTLMTVLFPLAYLLAAAVTFGFTQARTANLVYNATGLGPRVRFVSQVPARRLAWIYLTNLLAVLLSLGFAIPWAAIRTARARAEFLRLEATGPLDGFRASESTRVGATGDEVGDMFDIEVAL